MPEQPDPAVVIEEITVYVPGEPPLAIPKELIIAYQGAPTLLVSMKGEEPGTQIMFAGLPFTAKTRRSSIVVPQLSVKV
jgi:hypothetical protein